MRSMRRRREFYRGRATQEWIAALAPLGTDEHKPHLTDAPWVVLLFRVRSGTSAPGARSSRSRSGAEREDGRGRATAKRGTSELATGSPYPRPFLRMNRIVARRRHW